MAKTLRELHFHVVCVLNADRGAMGEAISVIEERLVKDTVVLFYFAGHGFSSNGENYIVAVDAPKITSERQLRFS